MLLPNELVRIILKIKFNTFRRLVISKKFEKYKDCHEVWFTSFYDYKNDVEINRIFFFSVDSFVMKLV